MFFKNKLKVRNRLCAYPNNIVLRIRSVERLPGHKTKAGVSDGRTEDKDFGKSC